jgi:hypothetical protein
VRLDENGQTLSNDLGTFQAFGARVLPEDKANLVPGIAYSIRPINISDTYCWVVAPDLPPLTFNN